MKSVKGQKIYDAHMHCFSSISLLNGVENFKKRMADKSIAGGTVLALIWTEPKKADRFSDNIACLYYKEKLDGIFTAFADFYDYPEDPDYYVEFAKWAIATGFDGFKSLLGLPSIRKRIGFGINDARFDKFFAFLEEEEIPYVIHLGNPSMYWDKDRAPAEAVRCGRVYDDTYPTLEELYQEGLDVLKKFPNLHMTFAHGLFMGDNHDRLREIMDTYPNITLDLTPNAPFYADISQDLDLWKKFFEDYQTRLMFGTDTYVPDDTMSTTLADIVCNFLETKGPYTCHDGSVIKGIDIDGEMLRNICWENAMRRVTPRPINRTMVVEECQRLLIEEKRLEDWEKENLKIAIEEFSK